MTTSIDLCSNTCYLDLETTGLTSDDEVVEIAIVDHAGSTLLHSLVRPVKHSNWTEAQAIHGISPSDVVAAPTLESLRAEIISAVNGKHLVIYNAAYDSDYLDGMLDGALSIRCCMESWAGYQSSDRWLKLVTAADMVAHEWGGEAHRALSDALACRSVWLYMHDPVEQEAATARIQERNNDRLAEQHLHRLNLQQEILDRKHAEYMDGFIRRWWIRKPDSTRHWSKGFYHSTAVADEWCEIFFGKPFRLVKLEDQFSNVFTRKSDIPDHLKPASYFDSSAWYQNELVPVAAYVGKRQGWPLYPVSECDRIRTKYPLRFTALDAPDGFELISTTEMRKRNYSATDIQNMNPAAERQNPYSGDFYPVYLVPKAVAV